ncbi:hypothetical protein IWQ62_000650 [Dispira parvispora]|uniref:Uncharacterized protein n=1 Tax=Dispira parvispora TaxID=1520584 RepID=A0A9W8AZQ7_9FUNG|nr:hypothetical protein IWQ62_000650 [Dispira parvispora]
MSTRQYAQRFIDLLHNLGYPHAQHLTDQQLEWAFQLESCGSFLHWLTDTLEPETQALGEGEVEIWNLLHERPELGAISEDIPTAPTVISEKELDLTLGRLTQEYELLTRQAGELDAEITQLADPLAKVKTRLNRTHDELERVREDNRKKEVAWGALALELDHTQRQELVALQGLLKDGTVPSEATSDVSHPYFFQALGTIQDIQSLHAQLVTDLTSFLGDTYENGQFIDERVRKEHAHLPERFVDMYAQADIEKERLLDVIQQTEYTRLQQQYRVAYLEELLRRVKPSGEPEVVEENGGDTDSKTVTEEWLHKLYETLDGSELLEMTIPTTVKEWVNETVGRGIESAQAKVSTAQCTALHDCLGHAAQLITDHLCEQESLQLLVETSGLTYHHWVTKASERMGALQRAHTCYQERMQTLQQPEFQQDLDQRTVLHKDDAYFLIIRDLLSFTQDDEGECNEPSRPSFLSCEGLVELAHQSTKNLRSTAERVDQRMEQWTGLVDRHAQHVGQLRKQACQTSPTGELFLIPRDTFDLMCQVKNDAGLLRPLLAEVTQQLTLRGTAAERRAFFNRVMRLLNDANNVQQLEQYLTTLSKGTAV